MSRRSGTRERATRKPVVVLAGEDRNDRRSLRSLLEQFCPEMRGRIVEINDSVRLRDASPDTLSRRVGTLAKKARARAVKENADLACLFVHEDLDRPDGVEYHEIHRRVQRALRNAVSSAHYVLAVWEIEAWLLLFPNALAGLVSTWQVPEQRRNRDTGRLNDPKKILMREVSRAGRQYRESDAPDVLAKAIDLGCVDHPAGTNRSWTQFRTDVEDCCRHHLRSRSGRAR